MKYLELEVDKVHVDIPQGTVRIGSQQLIEGIILSLGEEAILKDMDYAEILKFVNEAEKDNDGLLE